MIEHILENYNQVVIYGAKGWVGRSASELLFDSASETQLKKIILIGSKTESSFTTGLPANVYSASDAHPLLGQEILFINAAYLRREKLQEMGQDQYVSKNLEITNFPKTLVASGRISTLVNLSSGVAGRFALNSDLEIGDLYARCKVLDEREFTILCEKTQTNLVNCRIYSMAGKHINEFKNLALSSFISQAMQPSSLIEVRSPATFRCYVDSIDLVSVLLKLSLQKQSFWLDSGGTLVSLGELADKVATNFPKCLVIKSANSEESEDYFGDFERFNAISSNLDVELKDMQNQISETMKAFT